ncbi:MAG: class I SAM-dependent methyltransferase [Parcubacteria group bacterium]
MSKSETSDTPTFDGIFLKTVLTTAANFTKNKPWNELSVVDLGCYEGLVSIEFARQNVKSVLGIDSREANIAKSNFAKEAMGLDNLTFRQDDVLNLSKKTYGSFDITLCLGILYHLPQAEVFKFMEKVFEVTDNIAIFDTQVAMVDEIQVPYRDKIYHGRLFDESPDVHSNQSSSLGGQSFWLTKISLFNLIRDIGFELAGVVPYAGKSWRGADDRVTIVARKRQTNDKKIILPVFYKSEEDIFVEKDPYAFTIHKSNIVNYK